MSLKLHLGVNDVLEPNGFPTFDLATLLEEKYGLFSAYAERHGQDIADELAQSVSDAITLVAAGRTKGNPFRDGEEAITAGFKRFLDSREIETMGIPGVPTAAALMGKSARRKRTRGPRRPSFIDSGTLRINFRSWVEK